MAHGRPENRPFPGLPEGAFSKSVFHKHAEILGEVANEATALYLFHLMYIQFSHLIQEKNSLYLDLQNEKALVVDHTEPAFTEGIDG